MSKKVSRADGRASQKAILEAALIIILRDGIRNVKYKTVAEVAGVSSSATAYYFKDIPDLITQAFRYYLENYKQEMKVVRDIGRQLLARYADSNIEDPEVLLNLIDEYTAALLPMVTSDQEDVRTYILLDRVFRNQTLQAPEFYGALKEQDKLDRDSMADFFEQLGTASPEVDAVHLLSVLWFLSEQYLQAGPTKEHRDFCEVMIREILIKNVIGTQRKC